MSSGASVDMKAVQGNLRRLAKEAPELTDRLVGQWAEAVISEMKDETVVPRDEGGLRDSHGWNRVKAGTWRLFANRVYAAKQHRDHKTKAGWFQRTLVEQGFPMLEKTVQRIRKQLGQ